MEAPAVARRDIGKAGENRPLSAQFWIVASRRTEAIEMLTLDKNLVEKRKQLNFYKKRTRAQILHENLSRSSIVNRRLETIIDLAGVDDESTILDVGCGSGFTCGFWARRGHKVIGIDLCRGLLRFAKKGTVGDGPSGLKDYVVADMEHLPFRSNKLDFAVGIAVLHHVPKDVEAIREVKRVLRTHGKVAFSEPNAINPYLLIKGLFYVFLRTHEHMISRSIKWRFVKIFRNLDLRNICVKNVIFTPRGTNSKIISCLLNIEKKWQKQSILSNISACFVVVGEK